MDGWHTWATAGISKAVRAGTSFGFGLVTGGIVDVREYFMGFLEILVPLITEMTAQVNGISESVWEERWGLSVVQDFVTLELRERTLGPGKERLDSAGKP